MEGKGKEAKGMVDAVMEGKVMGLEAEEMEGKCA